MKPASRFKEVSCPGCSGRGYLPRFEQHPEGTCQAWSEECDKCKGSGKIEVPRTYEDWVKNEATAEEIVMFLSQHCTAEAISDYCDHFDMDCVACKASWLRSKIK